MRGTLYLLHFARPLHHARHYLGFVERDELARVAQHRAGRGSPLVAAVVAAGIEVHHVRSIPGTRTDERRLKNMHNLAQFCPFCEDEYRARCAAGMRRSRARRADRARGLASWIKAAGK